MNDIGFLVEEIVSGNYAKAREILEGILIEKTNAAMDVLKEELGISEASRIRRVKVRIKNGKVQRNKKVSGIKGYKMKNGKLVRMSSAERQHRKTGARHGKVKRRAEKSQIRRHMRQSLRKRKSMGVRR